MRYRVISFNEYDKTIYCFSECNSELILLNNGGRIMFRVEYELLRTIESQLQQVLNNGKVFFAGCSKDGGSGGGGCHGCSGCVGCTGCEGTN